MRLRRNGGNDLKVIAETDCTHVYFFQKYIVIPFPVADPRTLYRESHTRNETDGPLLTGKAQTRFCGRLQNPIRARLKQIRRLDPVKVHVVGTRYTARYIESFAVRQYLPEQPDRFNLAVKADVTEYAIRFPIKCRSRNASEQSFIPFRSIRTGTPKRQHFTAKRTLIYHQSAH